MRKGWEEAWRGRGRGREARSGAKRRHASLRCRADRVHHHHHRGPPGVPQRGKTLSPSSSPPLPRSARLRPLCFANRSPPMLLVQTLVSWLFRGFRVPGTGGMCWVTAACNGSCSRLSCHVYLKSSPIKWPLCAGRPPKLIPPLSKGDKPQYHRAKHE